MTFERRFRLDKLPPLTFSKSVKIRQVYWRLDSSWSIRIRQEDDPGDYRHTITIKGPRSGSGRPEIRTAIFDGIAPIDRAASLEILNNLLGSGKHHSIDKTRHYYEIGAVTWEIDEFHGPHKGLLIAEVHSQDESFIESIEVPAWAAHYEVTADPVYNNENLAYEDDPTWIREK
ncbi:MAG: hypothetical protein CME34_19535 [Gordonia sp.]|uniref:CYTH domain-containing protein n=1 Tax=Gordonia sp. (in: high G+C Gram-positive bacteria) TaxID=84139 RepID=UPI000C67C5DE|nr:CYTH domain-containing protein [Gordonia sp. (in: high G+C Gram-positive bacteria)]MAU84017.1 hypothetical protein [Gordonia sp. (in: high G+C Gram-positive bacteria)]